MSVLGSVLGLLGVAAAFRPKPEGVEKELVDAKLTIGRLEGELADATKALELERAHVWRIEVERDQLVNDLMALQHEHTNEQNALLSAYDHLGQMHDRAIQRLAVYEGLHGEQQPPLASQAQGAPLSQAQYLQLMASQQLAAQAQLQQKGAMLGQLGQQLGQMANQMQAQQAMLPNPQIGEHMIGLLGAIDPRGIWGPCTCIPARHDMLLGRVNQ